MRDNRDQKRLEEKNRIAGEALQAAKDRIVAGMRFLDPAVFALSDSPEETEGLIFCTDGRWLHYSANYILSCCTGGLRELTHHYLHVLLHCIFRHHSVSENIDRLSWNLAADVAVEALIQSFGMSQFESDGSVEREKYIRKFRTAAGGVSAERLYRYFRSPNVKDSDLLELEEIFRVDSHNLWYGRKQMPFRMNPEEEEDKENLEGDSEKTEENSDTGNEAETEPQTEDENKEESVEENKENRKEEDIDEEDREAQEREDQTERGSHDKKDTEEDRDADSPDWDQIAQMVKISLEAEHSGAEEQDMLAALNARTDRHVDYSTFLRKFAVRRENLKVDDNEFDYIYYTYGLQVYGDMPLVEPLEYSDEKSIRDLAIVIDTSASTEGELVESFIRRTFDMLTGSSEFKNRFNIHLIQCDSKVQSDQLLRSKEDIRTFMDHFEIRGFGGTDFRPAFQYVNTLLEEGTFRRLQGLLYFTDGKGIYPKRKPRYDTAFIFEDEESAAAAEIPSWAMKVVLGGHNEY